MAEAAEEPLWVYYDAACPGCVRDRRRFERLAGERGGRIHWVDITGRDEELKALGIDPLAAMLELHVRSESGRIYRELDAYIVLLRRTRWLSPVAWLIGLPLIKPLLGAWYRRWVRRRLCATGRL
ncbi:MAG: DUF393 domain-containing protein [Gammaproteobacteria bacterium]|uniref:thiol-disulfide oxidoreductase DCC family protein n=1 Tax=Pseudomaricurvus alcaniphilus TaxID=1166482 RepID=UPI0014090C51|nr:DUF393 domain-containing protein [Pseudomaricurvus alcaniphilus]MBR9913185.1 DUF393 domain-containing protein [Gammaproteobacteria bacterium]NHN39837.1 DUF393 domain-containing protein [Pseudomaricurvus alcaniphilus]